MPGIEQDSRIASNRQSKWVARLLYILGLFSIAAIIAIAYRTGKDDADVDWKRAVAGYKVLEEEHRHAMEEISRLKASLEFEKARSDRELQINKQAFEEISRTLQATSREMAEQKEDLRFYENVIQAESEGQGLQIRALRISATNRPERYGYTLIVVNGSYGKKKKKGTAKIELHGLDEGKAASVSVKNEHGKNSFPLKFKYYQKLDGVFDLPAHFQPRRIKVAVKMRDAKPASIEKWYDWPLLQAGQEKEARQKTGGVETEKGD